MNTNVEQNIIITIPNEYSEVFNKMTEYMSIVGVDMMANCNYCTNNINQNTLKCWTLFQLACISYYRNQISVADNMINFIIAQLNLTSDYIVRIDLADVYFLYGAGSIEDIFAPENAIEVDSYDSYVINDVKQNNILNFASNYNNPVKSIVNADNEFEVLYDSSVTPTLVSHTKTLKQIDAESYNIETFVCNFGDKNIKVYFKYDDTIVLADSIIVKAENNEVSYIVTDLEPVSVSISTKTHDIYIPLHLELDIVVGSSGDYLYNDSLGINEYSEPVTEYIKNADSDKWSYYKKYSFISPINLNSVITIKLKNNE